MLGGLGAAGFLLGQPGCLFRLPGRVARLVPVGLGGGVGGNLSGDFSAGRLDGGGPWASAAARAASA